MAGMWYYSDKKEQKGPISFDELRQLAQAGRIRPGDLVWQEGTKDWVRASLVDGLFESAPRGGDPGRADEPGPRRRPMRDERDERRPREERRPRDDRGDPDDFDDRPRRRPQKSSSRGLMIGLIIGGASLLVIGIVVVIIIMVSGGSSTSQIITPTREGKRIADRLTGSDPRDAAAGGGHSKTYSVQLTGGKSYSFHYRYTGGGGGGFGGMDPFLRLLDPSGNQVAADDDSGGGLNSMIFYRANNTGTYRIVCTTLGPGQTGGFELIVREN